MGGKLQTKKIDEAFGNQTVHTVKMGDWVTELQNKILENDDANVAIYDWRGGALLGYMESRRNTWTAAQEVYLLLKSFMSTYGIPAKQIHLIGHSLGSHVSGMAGKRMFAETGQKIGRISALDPAAPSYLEGPQEVRLAKSDALLVDVYHTDGASVLIPCGIFEPLGHLDFYPNNGTDQPSCHNDKTATAFQKELCDHMTAYQYYTKSLTQNVPAIRCSSYEDFLAGRCRTCKRNGCYRTGYFLDHPQSTRRKYLANGVVPESREGKYFYQTSSDESFCARSIHFEIQWKRGLARDLFKERKFGAGSKLNFTFETKSGHTFTYEKTDLDSLFPPTLSRRKTENLKFTVPVPCQLKPVPLSRITGQLVQNCPDQKVDMRSLWNGIFNSGCVEMKLHIRRIKVLDLLPSPIKSPHYRANFKPTSSLDNGQKLVFLDSA